MHHAVTSARRWWAIALFLLISAALLGVSACGVDPSQLTGSALADTIFLPLVNGPGTAATPEAPTAEAPLAANAIIPDQYIVVFQGEQVLAASVSAVAAEMTAQYNGEVLQNYDSALAGFAARFPAETSAAAAAALAQDPRVALVEPDRVITLDPIEDLTPADDNQLSAASAEIGAAGANAVQYAPSWGLDRLDQSALPLDSRYSYILAGSDVRAYIIDSGIRITHRDFGGRAIWGKNFTGDGKETDCNGHGTHVAGTVGGNTYGVAKGVTLVAVKVFSCGRGTAESVVIAAVDWVTQQKQANPTIPMVANMSLGGYSTAKNTAVLNSIKAGVIYVVSAGNDNSDACSVSPANVAAAITVGATNATDGRAAFSNYGRCVDLFAPGETIISAWYTSDTATFIADGTSMAAPHVAGVVARYLQWSPTATPATIHAALQRDATIGKITDPGANSPNALLFYTDSGLIPRFGAGSEVLKRSYTLADGWTVTNHPRLLGDVNGDRKADIVAFGTDGTYLSLSTGSGFGPGTKLFTDFSVNAGWTQDHPRVLGDVNGDGKVDLVGFGANGVYLALSTGTGFQAPVMTIAAFGTNAGGWTLDHPRTLGDVNGDGKADIVGFAEGGVSVAFSTGSGFQAPIMTIAAFGHLPNAGGWTRDHPRMVGDVNGDGKTDVVGFGISGTSVAFSTGMGFHSSIFIPYYGSSTGYPSVTRTPRTVADVNGDGRADLIGFADDAVYVSLSTHTNFTLPAVMLPAFVTNVGGWNATHLRLLGDVNGDGKADIVGFGESTVSWSLASIP